MIEVPYRALLLIITKVSGQDLKLNTKHLFDFFGKDKKRKQHTLHNDREDSE